VTTADQVSLPCSAGCTSASLQHGLEGVVLKQLDPPYLPGRRSPQWLKIKRERTQDVVIGGWTPGQGARAPLLGSLLLGVQAPAGLQYCGKAGTGFTGAVLLDLTRALHTLEQPASPFASPVPATESRHAHWVKLILAGEVAYTEWTPAGRLRHPAWRGLRTDKDPAYVYRAELPDRDAAAASKPNSETYVRWRRPGPGEGRRVLGRCGSWRSACSGQMFAVVYVGWPNCWARGFQSARNCCLACMACVEACSPAV
jgi:hypothetical protein